MALQGWCCTKTRAATTAIGGNADAQCGASVPNSPQTCPPLEKPPMLHASQKALHACTSCYPHAAKFGSSNTGCLFKPNRASHMYRHGSLTRNPRGGGGVGEHPTIQLVCCAPEATYVHSSRHLHHITMHLHSLNRAPSGDNHLWWSGGWLRWFGPSTCHMPLAGDNYLV